MKDNAAYYDAFAEGYETRRHQGYHRFLDDVEADLVRRWAGPDRRALEVGCGTGLIMDRLRGDFGSIAGIDLSPGMLAHAEAKGLDVRVASATELPFDDASFDVVYSFKVLAHVEGIDRALREIHRVLVPGGTAVLEFYNPASLRAVRKRLFAGRVAPGTRESEVYTRFDSLADATSRMEAAGLRVETHFGLLVVTPGAFAHRIPVLSRALQGAERALGGSALGRFGGFLSVIGRK